MTAPPCDCRGAAISSVIALVVARAGELASARRMGVTSACWVLLAEFCSAAKRRSVPIAVVATTAVVVVATMLQRCDLPLQAKACKNGGLGDTSLTYQNEWAAIEQAYQLFRTRIQSF